MAPEKHVATIAGPAAVAGPLDAGAGAGVEAPAPAGGHPPRAGDDDALAMVGTHTQDFDPAVAARAVRKIDWFLIPAMIFGCSYFIPSALSHLTSQQTDSCTTTKPSSAQQSSSA